jgi:hypothetical protein
MKCPRHVHIMEREGIIFCRVVGLKLSEEEATWETKA